MISDEGARLGAEAARRLAELNCCEIEEGLSDAEFDRVEREYGFQFADDHRAFLAAGLPVRKPREEGQTWDKPWPDWRNGDPEELRAHLNWEIDFIVERVEDGQWYPKLGERPASLDEAVDAARLLLTSAPTMVPVYGHRFLPEGRGTHGHPVLSMWGRDVICYGTDLVDYIDQDFADPPPEKTDEWQPKATVPFWKDLVTYY